MQPQLQKNGTIWVGVATPPVSVCVRERVCVFLQLRLEASAGGVQVDR